MTNEEYEKVIAEDRAEKRAKIKEKYPFLVLRNKQKPENGFRVEVPLLAIHIKNNYDIKIYNGQFRVYRNHYYSLVEDMQVLIQSEVPDEYIVPKNIQDVEQILLKDHRLLLKEKDLASDDYICFNNGVLKLSEKKLYDFEDKEVKDLIFIHKTQFDYDENTEPDEITDNFFNSTTKGNKKDIDFLYMILGVLISSKRSFKNIFYLNGVKDTGKSVFLLIAQNLLTNDDGTKDYSNVGLRTLTDENSFEFCQIINKRGNFAGETPDMSISNDTLLKSLSGGDEITANRKFKEPISFKNKAMLIFSGNTIPKFFTSDKSSISERMLIYIFKSQIPKDKQIKGLENKVDYKYIVRRAIEQLYVFIDNNEEFIVPDEIEANREQLLIESDTIYKFFKEKIKIVDNQNSRVSVKDLYKQYLYFMVEEGHIPTDYYGKPDEKRLKITQYKFTSEIKKYIGEQNYKKNLSYRGINGKEPTRTEVVFVNTEILTSETSLKDNDAQSKVVNGLF